MKDLDEIINKIEEWLQKIYDARKVLVEVFGNDFLNESAKDRVIAISNLRDCAIFAETVEEFLENADKDDSSAEVKQMMQKFIRNGLGIRRK